MHFWIFWWFFMNLWHGINVPMADGLSSSWITRLITGSSRDCHCELVRFVIAMKWIVPLKTHFSAPNKQRKIDFGRWFSYVILFHQLSFWNQLRCALPPCGATGWKKLRDGCLPRCFQTRTGGLGGWASLEWWLVKGDYPKTVLISGWTTMKIYHDLSR